MTMKMTKGVKRLKASRVLWIAALAGAVAACGPAGNTDDPDAGIDGKKKNVHEGAISADETWTKADSPHEVVGDVYVQDNATLTIEPGAVVRFARNTGLMIGYSSETGYLKAKGTADEPITFTTALPNKEPGAWSYIWLENGGAASVLEHAIIEYAGGDTSTYNGALVVMGEASKPTVNHNLFRNNKGYGVLGQGNGSFTQFTNNTITSSELNPIFLDTLSVGTLGDGNVLTGNGKDAIVSSGGLAISNQARWRDQGVPYRHEGDFIYIDSEQNTAMLTLDPGVVIQFEANNGLRVGYSSNGALRAIGTAEKPVVFRAMAGNENPGVWEGVQFYGGSVEGSEDNPQSSVLRNVLIQHAGKDGELTGTGALHLEESKPLLDNVTVEKSRVGLKLTGAANKGHPIDYFDSRVHFGTGENANGTDVIDDRS